MLQKYETVPFAITTHEECVKRMLFDLDLGKVKIDCDKKTDDSDVDKESEENSKKDKKSDESKNKKAERFLFQLQGGGWERFTQEVILIRPVLARISTVLL